MGPPAGWHHLNRASQVSAGIVRTVVGRSSDVARLGVALMSSSTRVAWAASYLAPVAMGATLLTMAGLVVGQLLAPEYLQVVRAPVHALLGCALAVWFCAHMAVVAHAFVSRSFPRQQRRAFLRLAWLGTGGYSIWREAVRVRSREFRHEEQE